MKPLIRFTVAFAIALLTTTAPGATRIWDGSVNGLWTNAGNWSNNLAPANGDALVFANGVTRLLATNAPGGATNFTSFTISGNGYVLVSSTLSLTNGLTCSSGLSGGVNTLRAPVRVARQQTWDVAAHSILVVQSNIGLTGVTLTLAGAGGIEINGNFFGGVDGNLVKRSTGRLELNGGNNVFNQLRVNSGTLVVDGVVTANSISISNGVVFGGAGTVSAFTNGGSLRIGTSTGAATGRLTVSAPGVATFLPGSSMEVQLFGLAPGAGHDQLRVSVPPDLTHGALSITRSAAFPLAVGQQFIIITNTGTAGFSTTFTNLPQGAFITNTLSPATVFQISYSGGNGNDVELTVVDVEPVATGFKRVWDGGGANGFWQTSGNWTNDLAPFQGDALEFTGNLQRVNTNNFAPGTLFDFITLNGGNPFTLRGNSVRLLNGLNNVAGTLDHILELPVELATNQSWHLEGPLVFAGSLSGGSSSTLIKDGAGLLQFSGGLPNDFTGTLVIRGGGAMFAAKFEGVPSVAGPLVVEADIRPALVQILTGGQFSNSPPVSVISSTSRLATVVFNTNTAPTVSAH
jgi:autotransporter-associated beta strand protein